MIDNPKGFIVALMANPHDQVSRNAYIDWLDEHGEHEEAERMRLYPQAHEWMTNFVEKFPDRTRYPVEDDDDVNYYTFPRMTYEDLLKMGRECLSGSGYVGNDMIAQDILNDHATEFMKNWSILTGVPTEMIPPDVFFRCAC